MDMKNHTRKSCTRVKIEVDLIAKLPHMVKINKKDDITRSIKCKWIHSQYDHKLQYCKQCFLQRHDEETCWNIHPELFEQDNKPKKRRTIENKKVKRNEVKNNVVRENNKHQQMKKEASTKGTSMAIQLEKWQRKIRRFRYQMRFMSWSRKIQKNNKYLQLRTQRRAPRNG